MSCRVRLAPSWCLSSGWLSYQAQCSRFLESTGHIFLRLLAPVPPWIAAGFRFQFEENVDVLDEVTFVSLRLVLPYLVLIEIMDSE